MKQEKDKNQQKIIDPTENSSSTKDEDFSREASKERDEFLSFQEDRLRQKKIKKIKIASISLLILALCVATFLYFRNKINSNKKTVESEIAVTLPDNVDHVVVTDGVVTENKVVENAPQQDEVVGVSENYKIKNVSIGGGVILSTDEGLTLTVTDVHSETVMSKDGKKTKLLISWKTNKLAKSEVKYSKDGNGIERNIKEDGYGFSHAVIMNDLEQSTRYVFTVKANDRSGKIVFSDPLAAFTGAKPVSVFDLISNQMGEIFGWALK